MTTAAEFERYHMKMTLKSIAETNAVGLDPDPWGAVADHVLKLVEAARQSTAPLAPEVKVLSSVTYTIIREPKEKK